MAMAHITEAERIALLKLERAVRACGLPGMMISGEKQHKALVEALKELDFSRGIDIDAVHRKQKAAA